MQTLRWRNYGLDLFSYGLEFFHTVNTIVIFSTLSDFSKISKNGYNDFFKLSEHMLDNTKKVTQKKK